VVSSSSLRGAAVKIFLAFVLSGIHTVTSEFLCGTDEFNSLKTMDYSMVA